MQNILTVVIPNKNRIDPNNESSKLLVRSLLWQTYKDFNVVIVDGGSSNSIKIKRWISGFPNFSFMEHGIGKEWNKPKLNNYAIKRAKSEYVLCTDADIMFAPDFIETIVSKLDPNHMIEARTLYWKDPMANRVYKGEIDLPKDIDLCRDGRIKYRTTCGGCQCLHMSKWELLRGYDETFVGWGSEDIDLLKRAGDNNIKVVWIGENRENILLFHQPHAKDLISDLKYQEKNKLLLFNKNRTINKNGWGG